MRQWLVRGTVLGACVASALTLFAVSRTTRPANAAAAVIGVVWMVFPYLTLAGLTLLFRRQRAAPFAFFTTLILVGTTGVFLLDSSATSLSSYPTPRPGTVRREGSVEGGPAGFDTPDDCGPAVPALLIPPVQLAAGTIVSGLAYFATRSYLRRRTPAVARA